MKSKILLDIDSPTYRQTKRAIDQYRKNDRILIPNHLAQELKDKCPGCATPFSKVKERAEYYGQTFCVDNCLSQWLKPK